MPEIDFRGPLDRCLAKCEAAAVQKILSNVPPPNAPSTLRAKYPQTKTLVHTGTMYKSVKHRISGEGANLIGEVGIFNEDVAKYAAWNERGTSRIPARPWLFPSFDETAPKAAEEMADEIFDQIEKALGW